MNRYIERLQFKNIRLNSCNSFFAAHFQKSLVVYNFRLNGELFVSDLQSKLLWSLFLSGPMRAYRQHNDLPIFTVVDPLIYVRFLLLSIHLFMFIVKTKLKLTCRKSDSDQKKNHENLHYFISILV